MEKYYLGISLTRWSMIQYCTSLWKLPVFKNHLIQDLKQYSLSPMISSTELRQHLDKLILPLPIKNELKIAVGTQGHKIQCWFRELSNLTPDITFADCIDHIHWSCYATVECTQSIKSLYKAELFPITFATWKLLCLYCIEECILDFWTKISTNNEHNDVFRKIATNKDSNVLINYWQLRVMHNLLESQDNIYNFNFRTLEEDLLMAQQFPNYAAFRYLWNCLDEPKKQSILRTIDTPGGNLYGLTLRNTFHSDIFMFILQQLMIHGSEEMLNKITILPSMLPDTNLWPHSSNVMSAVHDFNIDDNVQRLNIMLGLLSYMRTLRMYIGNDSEIRQVLYDFWKVHEFVYLEVLIRNIVAYRDIESLRYVIRHIKTWKEREWIMNFLDGWVSKKHYKISKTNTKFWKLCSEVVQDLRDSFVAVTQPAAPAVTGTLSCVKGKKCISNKK